MNAVEVRGLVKIYGSVRALDCLDLNVEEGTIHALLGPNGAGKTTLIRILTTQLLPNKGEAKVFGLEVTKHAQKIREMLGYVPQEVSLWTDLTGYENLLIYAKIYGIPSSERKRTIEEVLELMELKDAANRLVRTYSGGMFRKLEIASSIMIRPKILILDEPTIGLDPNARRTVWEKIIAYKKDFGTTVLFATHYMDEAERYADMITLMNKGKVIRSGTADDLKSIIGGDRVSIKVSNVEKVLEIVSHFNDISLKYTSDNEVVLLVDKPHVNLPLILKSIESEGIEIKELKIKEASLDDVFMALTGKSTGEGVGRMKDLLSERKMIRRGA